jgi:hypothetical protein
MERKREERKLLSKKIGSKEKSTAAGEKAARTNLEVVSGWRKRETRADQLLYRSSELDGQEAGEHTHELFPERDERKAGAFKPTATRSALFLLLPCPVLETAAHLDSHISPSPRRVSLPHRLEGRANSGNGRRVRGGRHGRSGDERSAGGSEKKSGGGGEHGRRRERNVLMRRKGKGKGGREEVERGKERVIGKTRTLE